MRGGRRRCSCFTAVAAPSLFPVTWRRAASCSACCLCDPRANLGVMAPRRGPGQTNFAGNLPGEMDGESKARWRVGVDLPAFYAGQRSGPFKLEDEKMQALTEADRELFWLASEVNNCAETARSLLVGEADYAAENLE